MKILLSLSILVTFLFPVSTFAAMSSVSFVAPTRAIGVGDTILVPVMLSVPDQVGINAFQGSITISGPAHLKSVSIGGSIFTIWPEVPTVVNNTVQFLGGTPGSVYGSPLRVVTLAISTTDVGNVRVSSTGATEYTGDGKGTPQSVKDSEMTFTVGPKGEFPNDELGDFLKKDLTPPNHFAITLARDPSLFGNSYFISFATHDTASGVDHYEVSENGGPWILATDAYVLKDQSLRGSVSVRAIDTARNVRDETLMFKEDNNYSIFVWVGIALFIVVFFVRFFLKKKQRM